MTIPPKSPDDEVETSPTVDLTAPSFCAHLDRMGRDKSRAWNSYLPLAFAEGTGLPMAIWRCLVRSINQLPHPAADIAWTLRRDPGFVVVTEIDGRNVYRMAAVEIGSYIRHCLQQSQAEIERLICDSLLRMTRCLKGSNQKDWYSADPYIRRHIIDHAIKSGNLNWLANDLIYLSAAEPSRILRAMYETAGKHRSLAVYRSCYDRLQYGHPEDNLSYLQLSAYQNGEIDLAVRIDALRAKRRWSVRWAQRTNDAVHHVLGRHVEKGKSNLRQIGSLNRGVHSIDVVDVRGRSILVSCGCDYQVRVWDLEPAVALNEPLRPSSLPWRVALFRTDDTIRLLVLGAMGEILGWKWVDSFEPLGQLGRVISLDMAKVMAAHPTGNKILIAAGGAHLQLFQCEEDKCVELQVEDRLLMPAVLSMGVTSAGKVLIAVGDLNGIELVSEEGKALWEKKTVSGGWWPAKATSAAMTNVGAEDMAIFGTDNGNIEIYSCSTGALRMSASQAHRSAVTALTVANLGSTRVLLSGGREGLIRLWQLPELIPAGSDLRGHDEGLTEIKVTQIKSVPSIISASADATIRVWDYPKDKLAVAAPGWTEAALGVAVGVLNGIETVMSLADTGQIRLWSCSTGLPLPGHPFTLPFGDPPVNTFALGRYAGKQCGAVSVTLNQVLIWDPITGQGKLVNEPAKPKNQVRGLVHDIWCACVGTVYGRLARVAYYDRRDKSFVQAFDLETGQRMSARIKAEFPLNTLRLGDVNGDAVLCTRIHGLLTAARLRDGHIVGTPVNPRLDKELFDFAFPVAVGTFADEGLLMMTSGSRTTVSIASMTTGLYKGSIDMGTAVQSIAVASDGVVVGTRKGLTKLGVVPN